MIRKILIPVLLAVGVYGIIWADVVSRAKESYLQAERYMDWSSHPEKKVAFYQREFEQQKESLDRDLGRGKLDQKAYDRQLADLTFDRDFRVNESSLKYAYQWYKDTYELFSPPDSKWVRQARVEAPKALELWKQELREKKIPFEEWMFN